MPCRSTHYWHGNAHEHKTKRRIPRIDRPDPRPVTGSNEQTDLADHTQSSKERRLEGPRHRARRRRVRFTIDKRQDRPDDDSNRSRQAKQQQDARSTAWNDLDPQDQRGLTIARSLAWQALLDAEAEDEARQQSGEQDVGVSHTRQEKDVTE